MSSGKCRVPHSGLVTKDTGLCGSRHVTDDTGGTLDVRRPYILTSCLRRAERGSNQPRHVSVCLSVRLSDRIYLSIQLSLCVCVSVCAPSDPRTLLIPLTYTAAQLADFVPKSTEC